MPSSYTADLANKILLDNAVIYWNSGDGVYVSGDLAKSSEPEDFKTTRLLRYQIAGVKYTKAATDGVDFTAAHVITASKWGIILIEIDAAGDFATKVPASTQAYATEAEAVAALPAVTTSKVAVGYLLIENNAGDWTANTDDLTNASDLTSATFVNLTAGMAKFGATRGGITFNKNAEWRNVPFDGASGETGGLYRKVGGVPTLSGTLLLFDPDTVAEVLDPGSTSATIGTDPNAVQRITPLAFRTMLPVADHFRFEAVWKRGNGGTAKIVFPLGMVEMGELSAQDNNEGEIAITIRAINDPEDIDGTDEVPAAYYYEFTGADVTVA